VLGLFTLAMLLAAAPSASADVRKKTLVCRGPLKTRVTTKTKSEGRVFGKLTIELRFKKTTGPAHLGLDLERGQCGFARSTLASTSHQRVWLEGPWVHLKTVISGDANGRQSVSYEFPMSQEAKNPKKLITFKLRRGDRISSDGIHVHHRPAVSTPRFRRP